MVGLLMAASGSLVAVTAAPATAAGVLDLVAPATDNYKTWLGDRGGPHDPDNRTSLLFTGITVGGTTYVVPQAVRDANGSPVGAATEWHAAGGIPLAETVGGPVVARLAFDHDGANAWSYFRLWPDGVFGPLMTIDRSAFVAPPHTPVAGTFVLRDTGGTVLATRAVRYRHDAGVAALPESSGEWHGPLGRWHVGTDTSKPTPLNWPSAIAVSGTPSGAHQAQVTVPAGQAATVYVAPVDIAGLAVPRVPESLGLAWSPAGAGRPTATTGTQAWRPVPVTLPQGSYGLQASGTCQSACRYDFAPQALTGASTQVVASAAATYRPDAEIRPAGGAWTGADVVNGDAAGQTVAAEVPVGSSRDFDVRVTNAGTQTDTFGLADARSGTHTGFDYTWRYQGADVTSQVHDDGWFVLPDVPVGATRILQLTVTAKPDTPAGTAAAYKLHAYHSPAGDGIKDVVGLSLTAAPAEPGGDDGYQRPPGAPEVPIQPCSRYAAPDGSDADTGTQASPVHSLKRLSDLLQPGQTGCLEDGGEFVLTEGGTGIISGGQPGSPKIIRPETPGARASVLSVPKFLVPGNQSDVILMDLDLRGSPDTGGGNLLQVNGDRVMLDGVDLSWSRNICLGVGNDIDAAEDFVLIDSRIHDCGSTHDNNPADPGGAHGAYLQFVRDGGDVDGWGAIVYNSLLDHNDARGLQLYPDADDVHVDRSVLYGNGANLNLGAYGPAVRPERNLVTRTIIANSRLDFDDPDDPNPTSTEDVLGFFPSGSHNGAGNVVADSCLSNTWRPGHLFAVTNGGNSLVLEDMTLDQPPTFVDAAARDFRLAEGSTCQGMGLSDASRLPAAEPAEPADLTQLSAAAVKGKPKVGRSLRAVPGDWTPEPAAYSHRWFLDGKKVKGAKGSGWTLSLRKAWRGERASVRITVRAPEGYADAVVTAVKRQRIR